MLRLSLFAIAGAAVLLGGCASAGWHTYASAPMQTASADGPLICRDAPPTGSRLSARECHTQRDWDQIKSNGDDTLSLEAARSMPTTDPGSANGR